MRRPRQEASLPQLLEAALVDVAVLIFGGCCSNVVVLEELTHILPRSASLVSLAQYALVSIVGLWMHVERAPVRGRRRWRLLKRAVPLHHWIFMVILFFFATQLNNMALGYDVSMPLHIVFRSGGLVVSMLLGFVVLRRRYAVREIAAVLSVTAGVVVSTLASATSHNSQENGSEMLLGNIPAFAFGVFLLVVAMFVSAALGIYQQVVYERYGRQWREGLFYTHVLGLPLFVVFAPDIVVQWRQLLAVSAVPTPQDFHFGLVGRLPQAWVLLAASAATQYLCISGVHRLSSQTSAVTLNLVLTVRKFASLALSMVLFGNAWGGWHTLGALLVFAGTLAHSCRPGGAWRASGKPGRSGKSGGVVKLETLGKAKASAGVQETTKRRKSRARRAQAD